MATTNRNYAVERFSLQIEGRNCGFVKSVEGGGISAEVAREPAGNDHFIKKHISQPIFEDLVLQTNLSMHKQFYDWIAATWNGKYVRKDMAIYTVNPQRQIDREAHFFNAQISEVTIPAMDSSSKEPGYMTIRFQPEYSRMAKSSGRLENNVNQAQDSGWRSGNFKLQIGGLECKRVSRVDTFTVIQPFETSAPGEHRAYFQEPGKIDFPNLKITLLERDAQTWIDWHEDFVIKGNSAENREKNGSLTFLSPNYRTELAHINFFNLGIFRLLPENPQVQPDQPGNLIAELYCERMEFGFP